MLTAINITTDYPIWTILFCFLLGAVYAGVLYYKESKLDTIAKWLKNSLLIFRFLAVSIIAFLLLSPFIKTIFNKTEKPIIIFAQDNSNSLLIHQDSAFYANNYLKKLNALKEKLEKDYEVKSFTFGEKVKEEGTIDFTEKGTLPLLLPLGTTMVLVVCPDPVISIVELGDILSIVKDTSAY